MKKRICAAFIVLSGLSAGADEWKFSLGATYRSFDDVKLKQVNFSNPAYPNSPYVNGETQDLGANQSLIVVEDRFNQAPGTPGVSGAALADINVTLETLAAPAVDTDLGGQAGVVIGASYPLAIEGRWGMLWNLDLSLTATTPGMNETFAAQSGFNVFVVPAGTLVGVPHDPGTPAGADYGPVVLQPGVGGTPFVDGLVHFDMDLNVFTLATGVSGIFQRGNFGLLVGAGPSLTIADAEVDVVERAQWSAAAPSQAGTDIYAPRRQRRSTVQGLLGAYANVGILYQIDERMSASVEVRYDHLFSDLQTGLADVDLSGPSGVVKVTFGF